MIFVDQDGARYYGQLQPGASAPGHILVLTPERSGESRRVEPYGLCPFKILTATLDELSCLYRAGFHVRRV